MAESDSPNWTTREFDRYVAPSGWTLESRSMDSHHIETWKINASNMARMFAAVYGDEVPQEGLDSIEYMRGLHIDYHRKFTLSFVRSAWGARNYRLVQELREMTNALRLRAQVERPTFAQLRAIGMTVVTATGKTAYQRPTAFNLTGPSGYFATEIIRRVNEEKELNEWNSYHSSGRRASNPRVGALPDQPSLPGPPMTPAERRLAGKEAPKTAAGKRICWNYNSHSGCSDSSFERAHEYYKNYEQLSYSVKIALFRRYGFKRRGELSVTSIADQIQSLRQEDQEEANPHSRTTSRSRRSEPPG